MRLAIRLITLFAAFVLVALLVLRFWVLPQFQNSGTTMAALRLSQAVVRFQKDHGNAPGMSPGEMEIGRPVLDPVPEKIIAALQGDNPSEKNYLDDFPDEVFRDGVIVDSFGRPFRYGLDPDGILTVTSAGANGRFGDDDDISGQGTGEGKSVPDTTSEN